MCIVYPYRSSRRALLAEKNADDDGKV